MPTKTPKPSFDISNIREFIYWWNSNFYIDYWWRKKYKVPFNSILHRQACLLDMFIEYEEERLIQKYIRDSKTEKEDREDYLFTGRPFKTDIELSEKTVEELYDRLDLKGYNERQRQKKSKA